jgi:hypothetical protein
MENLTDDENFSETNEENKSIDDFEEPEEPEESEETIEEKIDLKPVRKVKFVKEAVRTLKFPLKKKVEADKDKQEDDKTLKLLKKHVKKQPNTIEQWTKARGISKLQDLFGYTQDGDLEIGRVLDGDQKKIITLSQYKEASAEYIQKKLKEKKEQIKKAEEEYMTAKRNLQSVMAEYLVSDKSGADVSEVLRANQEVHDKECILNTLAKYPRNNEEYLYKKLKQSELTLNAHDEKVIVDPVMFTDYSYFSPELLFMPAEDEKTLNLEQSNSNNNDSNTNANESNNNSTMSGDQKRQLSMAAIMAIKARKAARGY